MSEWDQTVQNEWDISVNVTILQNRTNNRFTIHNMYSIQIAEFATLDALVKAVNDAVREFLPDE